MDKGIYAKFNTTKGLIVVKLTEDLTTDHADFRTFSKIRSVKSALSASSAVNKTSIPFTRHFLDSLFIRFDLKTIFRE